MEGISVSVYKSLRAYWRRKDYVKLDGSACSRRSKAVKLGSTRRGSRRRRRIRIKAKLRIVPSPKKLFVWIRDAYVKMMQGLANSRVVVNTGYGGAIGGRDISAFGKRRVKEHGALAQGQLLPREAAKLSSAIICQQNNIIEGN